MKKQPSEIQWRMGNINDVICLGFLPDSVNFQGTEPPFLDGTPFTYAIHGIQGLQKWSGWISREYFKCPDSIIWNNTEWQESLGKTVIMGISLVKESCCILQNYEAKLSSQRERKRKNSLSILCFIQTLKCFFILNPLCKISLQSCEKTVLLGIF